MGRPGTDLELSVSFAIFPSKGLHDVIEGVHDQAWIAVLSCTGKV